MIFTLRHTITIALTMCAMMILPTVQTQAFAKPAKKAKPYKFKALEANRPELDLPLSDGTKRVIAHNMPEFVYSKDLPLNGLNDPANYDLTGPTKKLWGSLQYKSMLAQLRDDFTLEEAVDFEIEMAQKLGIDGFQFYYPIVAGDLLDHWNKTIHMFFKVASEKYPDFKMTLCICTPNKYRTRNPLERINFMASKIGKLLNDPSIEDAWLKTPDGRTIMFLWRGAGITGRKRDEEPVAERAYAYEMLEEKLGKDLAYIYMIESGEGIKDIIDYFPGIWAWTSANGAGRDFWQEIATVCKERNREYTQTVFPDFYDSKNTTIEGGKLLFDPDDVLAIGPENCFKRHHFLGLSAAYRSTLQQAIDYDANFINIATWNDYPEGHHLIPEINHNFGFSVLLEYYKNIWQGHPEKNDKDMAVVFYKKYPLASKPSKVNVTLRTFRTAYSTGEDGEDGIEVVTMLTQPGQLYINGQFIETVNAGLKATRVPMTPGRVTVRVERDGKMIIDLKPTEWITTEPYRTDRFTYSFSSEFMKYHKMLFGDLEPMYSDEYAEDENGVPNWKKRALNR